MVLVLTLEGAAAAAFPGLAAAAFGSAAFTGLAGKLLRAFSSMMAKALRLAA